MSWMQKYGSDLSPNQIKRLPRAEMIPQAKACCLLEHLSDSEIEAMTVRQLHFEINSIVSWMSHSQFE